ncbi:MAG: DUF4105 domain-containing protein [Myxococcaceae bacterium]
MPLLLVIAPLWVAAAMPAGAENVVLVPSEVAWTEADREDLRLALESLPPALRDFPGGPLELEKHASEKPFGLGGWTDDRTRFHLHRRAPSTERRAALKLEGLSDEAQDRLWRRRAFVHAILQRWDDARAWSDRTAWRRLSGWLFPFERLFTWSERPSNLYEGAYSRALGATSASLDLVTFAEEYFIPAPEGPPDESLWCQEFSKVRVFEQLLQESLGVEPPPPAHCPAFEAWAELDALSHLEVLLVASSGRSPESLFGHLLLRPVYREGETIRPPTLQTVIQIAAMTDSEHGALYLARGIFGGYRITVFTITAGDLAREVLEFEDRTVRRFRVNATAEENRRLLQRAWELERRGYYDYKFFTDNCASVLVSMLESVLDEQLDVRYRGAFVVSPTVALDALAETVRPLNGQDTPLLSPEWGRLESVRDLAVDAELRRRELERSLVERAAPREREVLVESFEQARSPEPARRLAAWKALSELTFALARRDELAEALYAWWALTVRVERRALEQAKREELEIDAERLRGRTIPRAPGEEVEVRQRLFERESDMALRQMVLDRAEQRRASLERVERRPPTPKEAERLQACERTRAAFDALTTLQGELVEQRFADRDPHAWLTGDQSVRMQRERDALERAPNRSGSWRVELAGGIRHREGAPAEPVVAIHTAGFHERLGDGRVHGLNPLAELRVLEAEVLLRPVMGLPELLSSRFTLMGYRSLLRDPAGLRNRLVDHFGWGFSISGEHRPEHLLRDRALAEVDAIIILHEAAEARSHTVLGVGAAALIGRTETALGVGAAPRLSLSHRTPLPGSALNALRVEALWRPMVSTATGTPWLHEASASLSADILVPGPGAFALLVGPRVQVSGTWRGGQLPVPEVIAMLALEPTRRR